MKSVAKLKQQFLNELQTQQGLQPRTCASYSRCLECFFAVSQMSDVTDLTEKQLTRFKRHLRKPARVKVAPSAKPFSLRTQNFYLVVLRRFLTFLERQGVVVPSAKEITLTSVPLPLRDCLTVRECRSLLAAPNSTDLVGKRDRAILILLLHTGLRVAELCALEREDFTATRAELQIARGTAHARIACLSPETATAVADYLATRTDKHPVLFVRYGRKENDGGDLRIHPRAVQRLVQQYALLSFYHAIL